ncbi:spore germination protein [Paenibacillus sp. CC-CFT747]|nr:spore germination protein [Paenibacillus sp. CC-CFT747]
MSINRVEQTLEEFPYSPFPQIINTERPDRLTSNLMEGRIVLLMNGSPVGLIFPISFLSLYQSPDDYNNRWLVGSFFRMIRLFSFVTAITLPSLYIAVVSFHFEVIPNELLFPLKSSVQDIPFPPLVEAIIMELTIDLIREAGVRLPTSIGQTIAIVGGLVIGDAVVKAGLVSNITIIVVALTAIASFAVPSSDLSGTLRILRFPSWLGPLCSVSLAWSLVFYSSCWKCAGSNPSAFPTFPSWIPGCGKPSRNSSGCQAVEPMAKEAGRLTLLHFFYFLLNAQIGEESSACLTGFIPPRDMTGGYPFCSQDWHAK